VKLSRLLINTRAEYLAFFATSDSDFKVKLSEPSTGISQVLPTMDGMDSAVFLSRQLLHIQEVRWLA